MFNVIIGLPCDPTGKLLPEGSPPPPWNDAAPSDFTPYTLREAYETADLLFQRNKMPADCDPPFANAQNLYATIDATEVGDIPWQSFTVSYKTEEDEDEIDTPWKLKEYDVWPVS